MDSIVHFEIPAANVKRAQNFYKKGFSWNFKDYPEMKYTILHTGPIDKNGMSKKPGYINGGMFKRNSKIKNVVITINVNNIKKSLDDIKKLGGKVIQNTIPVGDMGWVAYFKDTENNVMGLWQTK